MFKALFSWFFDNAPQTAKPAEPSPAPAPYKVETPPPAPEPAKCGCGRSTTGFCVGLHKLSAEEWAAHADNPVKAPTAPGGSEYRVEATAPVTETKPTKPSTKKAPAKKTVRRTADKPAPVAAIKAAPKPRAKRAPK